MIYKGDRITLLANMTYKNHPEKNEDVGVGHDEGFGNYLQFQVKDATPKRSGNCGFFTYGYMYVRVYTDLKLKVNDSVTIKDFLYVQRKNNIVVIGITIKEGNPLKTKYDVEEEEVIESKLDGVGF